MLRPPRPVRSAASLLALVLAGACAPGGAPSAEPAAAASPPPAAAPETPPAPALGGVGWVVWESYRDGEWRIYRRGLDRSPAEPLGAALPGRRPCCPQLSPDGTRVAYLSLPQASGGRRRDDGEEEEGPPGELRLIGIDGRGERTLADGVRPFSLYRGVAWLDDRRLLHLDEAARTVELDLESGASRPVVAEPHRGGDGAALGWLPDPTLRWATTHSPMFSPLDAAARRVRPGKLLGGCQPTFTPDGAFAVWIAGAGGPIRRIRLATGEIGTVLAKSDRRLPPGQGYVYFPMVSRDGRAIAFAASPDEHDATTGNYDVFVADLDPETLEILGEPVRMTSHAASDRAPDVWVAPPPPGTVRARPPEPPRPPPVPTTGWPSDRAGLSFLWETGDRPNEVEDPALGGRRAVGLAPSGRAFFDRHFALALEGGLFLADQPSGAQVLRDSRRTNELTIEVTVVAGEGEPGREGRILSSSARDAMPNFALVQDGRRLLVALFTSTARLDPSRQRLAVAELPLGKPAHVVVAYTPGRLVAYLDGKAVTDTDAIASGFHHWKDRPLAFGGAHRLEAPWRGRLEGIALYDRFLGAAEVQENARRYREKVVARAPVERREVEARLVAVSRLPTLEEIAPYRDALALFEYQATPAGGKPGERLWVVHRVLLDGEVLPVTRRAPGSTHRLVLEPFAAHPELEGLVLGKTLAGPPPGPLAFDAALD